MEGRHQGGQYRNPVRWLALCRSMMNFASSRSFSPLPARGRGELIVETQSSRRYTSFTFLSGRLRTGLPVAAKIALSTAGATTQMVGSPTPPQKS